jgi:hydrogenase maturation protein HypF
LQLCRPDRTPIDGDPIAAAARLLADGRIVAVKGIGGFHLACRADREHVVAGLRNRKLRDGKPLAIMAPDLVAAHRLCKLSAADVETLASPAAPIVLAPKATGHGLAPSIAPGCGNFGIMLPYAPIHHLLFAQGLGPLVMTSANLAGQPLTYEDHDAFEQLADVADAFLTHNRRIFRPIDDSVVFTFRDEVIPLRRARGYAPQPLRVEAMETAAAAPSKTRCASAEVARLRILAVGGELKSTVCLYSSGEAIISEHLGDLTRPETYRHFLGAVERLKELFAFEPQLVAHDLHPQYLSTQYGRGLDIPAIGVQHHHAHIASVMAERSEAGPLIGLSCDGAGYGTDGGVWGCEVLHCQAGEFERLGHLKYFPLVGGNAAALETWRPAAALLRQALGRQWRKRLLELGKRSGSTVGSRELEVFEQQALAGVNAPPTSSLGRVFDAVSFLLGLCARNRHEAEAAMALEAAAAERSAEPYSYDVSEQGGSVSISLSPAVVQIVAAVDAGRATGEISARFHETIARALADAATAASKIARTETIALSGGCFANRRLLTRLIGLLELQGVRVLYNRRVPSGDGGLSLGQAFVAAWKAVGDETLRQDAAR